jgi:hypothetical protein
MSLGKVMAIFEYRHPWNLLDNPLPFGIASSDEFNILATRRWVHVPSGLPGPRVYAGLPRPHVPSGLSRPWACAGLPWPQVSTGLSGPPAPIGLDWPHPHLYMRDMFHNAVPDLWRYDLSVWSIKIILARHNMRSSDFHMLKRLPDDLCHILIYVVSQMPQMEPQYFGL